MNTFDINRFNNEFVLNNNSENIVKVLYWSKTKYNNEFVINKIRPFLNNTNLLLFKKIIKIIWFKKIHIWFDLSRKVVKFYIWIYDLWIKESFKLINDIRLVLWINEVYEIEKNFLKFDCLWFDVLCNNIELKVYEIVKDKFMYDEIELLNIDEIDIKEIWFLKSFSWRKKIFFRFNKLIDISIFNNIFSISEDNINKKVKYYCVENNKKEIYFI